MDYRIIKLPDCFTEIAYAYNDRCENDDVCVNYNFYLNRIAEIYSIKLLKKFHNYQHLIICIPNYITVGKIKYYIQRRYNNIYIFDDSGNLCEKGFIKMIIYKNKILLSNKKSWKILDKF